MSLSGTVRTFTLSDSFIADYKDKQPEWGYNGLGYVVYKRTYSREKEDGKLEEFWETCRRVVEATYDIQKKHCKQLRLPWDDRKAQKSAQEMFRRMWEFKWLPPGRGMWMMGTPTVDKLGGTSLNNCAFISTKEVSIDFAEPFCWMMDMLMLGLGVGFDTKGAGLIKIHQPAYSENFIVEDSREGWVKLIRTILEAYVGKGAIPKNIDYSQVRPEGVPIKGFGGTSSGPGPLKELSESLQRILNEKIGQELESTTIVDIGNLIGRCVVSGNIRRSAEIAFGEIDDAKFLELKNPEKNKEALMSHRWASNNSIFAEVGMDYSKTAEMIAKNGEPGFLWLENAREFSRMDESDWKDGNSLGGNPCFHGDTLIAVADGRHVVPIKQLADEGKDVPVYSLTPEGKIEIQWARNPRITRQDAQLVRVTLDGGSYLDVTPDHKMILRDGSIKEAKDLVEGDSLPVRKKYQDTIVANKKKYWRMEIDVNNPNKRIFEHRLISKFMEPTSWKEKYDAEKKNGWVGGGLVVHHKDYNPLNNAPNNLQIMTFKEHSKFHSERDRAGAKNGMYGCTHTDETKALIGAKTLERIQNLDFRKKLSESHTPEERAATAARWSKQRQKENKEYWLEQEKHTDLTTVWVNDKMFVNKSCQHCQSDFLVPWSQRDRMYCSIQCLNVYLSTLEARKNGLRTAFTNRQQETLHDQIMIFKDLQKSLSREPQKKEWEAACKTKGVSFRLRSPSSASNNPYSLKSFADLKERSMSYNHRVLNVKPLEGNHVVYNLTVDKNHTVMVSLTRDPLATAFYMQGVCQCLEQTLHDKEICCLVETFPEKHDSFEDYRKTLKYAYLYAKTVTLVPTHNARTNMVVMKNRRIGCSMSGIVQAIQKFGRRKFLSTFCDQGYDYIKQVDKSYSDWLCVRTSIKTTSVKPSGTISLLVGATPGIHFPHAKHYLRRVRLQENSPLVKTLYVAGYPIEKDKYSPSTVVATFPVEERNFDRSKDDVTMWEQLEFAAQMQRYWADNQVSVTVTFKPEEAKDIKYALELYETRLKGVSFLPLQNHGYEQAPYETCTEEKYKELMQNITPLNAEMLIHENDSKYCDGEYCVV